MAPEASFVWAGYESAGRASRSSADLRLGLGASVGQSDYPTTMSGTCSGRTWHMRSFTITTGAWPQRLGSASSRVKRPSSVVCQVGSEPADELVHNRLAALAIAGRARTRGSCRSPLGSGRSRSRSSPLPICRPLAPEDWATLDVFLWHVAIPVLDVVQDRDEGAAHGELLFFCSSICGQITTRRCVETSS